MARIPDEEHREAMLNRFHAQEGFGGNPLDNGNYWKLTPAMFERGLKYGVINDFNFADNIVTNYDALWKGYEREIVGKGWIDIHEKAREENEFAKNHEVAQILAAQGDHIKILPAHVSHGWKNPDFMIDGNIYELKNPSSHKLATIWRDIRVADKQARQSGVVISLSRDVVYNAFLSGLRGQILNKDNPLETRHFIVIHDGNIFRYTRSDVLDKGEKAREQQITEWEANGRNRVED